MDTRTLLISASIASLILIIGFVLFSRHRASRRFNRSVDTTITKFQVEAGSISSWWRVTADANNTHLLTSIESTSESPLMK